MPLGLGAGGCVEGVGVLAKTQCSSRVCGGVQIQAGGVRVLNKYSKLVVDLGFLRLECSPKDKI